MLKVDVARHVLTEVGWNARLHGSEMRGEAPVSAHLHVPGTEHLRVSMLACWSDLLMGLLAVRAMSPRVPTTLELGVELYRPPPGAGLVHGRAWMVKDGRSVLCFAAEFADDTGDTFAEAAGSFMVAGDPGVRLAEEVDLSPAPQHSRLTMPIAERVGCMRSGPGFVTLPRREDGLNSANTINGGLLAIAAEEALLSLAEGRSLSSLSLRYLRPARVGPAVARARLRGDLGVIEVHDAGMADRLAVHATGRLFSAS